jgi:hypothetical protein
LFRDTSTGSWTPQSVASGSTPTLRSITGDALAPRILVASSAGIYQSSGDGKWSLLNTGTFANFTGIYAMSSNEFYAVDGTALYRGFGTTFSQVASVGAYTGVYAPNEATIYTFGGGRGISIGVYPRISSCSGSTCTDENPGSSSGGALNAMIGFGAYNDDLYVTGTKYPLHTPGGSKWTALPANTTPNACSAVWGVDSSHLWFVCQGGLYLYDEATTTFSSPLLPNVETFGGTAAMWGTDANNIYLIANGIYHYY